MASARYTSCPVLLEDQWLIVINKTHGVLSHPNRGDTNPTCSFDGAWDDEEKTFATPAGRVWLIHRLDQDTSGVLLGAKDARTAEALREAFERDEVTKRYLALGVGGGLKTSGQWLDHLRVNHQRGKVRTEVVRGARPNAESHFRLLRYDPALRLSLIEIELITGKTHQIRVQAAARHVPVAGDDVYGHFARNRELRKVPGIKRLCLHARELHFRHPQTKEPVIVQAPVPDELATWMHVA